MADEWTIKGALDWTVGYLERKGDENPRLSAEWLLSSACQLPRIQLYMNFERPLAEGERELLRGFVSRRGTGEPLQYITGEAPFRHVTLKVRPGVLIPRPETEVLVSEALALLPPADKRVAFDSTIEAWEGDLLKAAQEAESSSDQTAPAAAAEAEARLEQRFDAPIGARSEEDSLSEAAGEDGGEATVAAPSEVATPKRSMPYLVADICTGSGCIAVSLATERPDVRVFATDIDGGAVALAQENAERCAVTDRVKVVQSNLGEQLPPAALGRLDLVVSNPPYVPTALLESLPREVASFEPSLALDGGEDGLGLFRQLAPWALTALKPGGGFACELFEEHMEAAREIAQNCGFEETRIVEDLTGRPRVLVARKPAASPEGDWL